MAHSHSHSSVQAPDNSNARRLLWAFIVTAGFMLIEAVGGAISGSLALLADAGHMLTDSAALLFALLAVRFASRPPNACWRFGSYIGVARSGILTYAPQRYTCLATCWARSARSWRPW